MEKMKKMSINVQGYGVSHGFAPKARWGFTGTPDFGRICRELEAAGCSVGLVSTKSSAALTLVNSRRGFVVVPKDGWPCAAAPHWKCVAGDEVRAALGRPIIGQRLEEPECPERFRHLQRPDRWSVVYEWGSLIERAWFDLDSGFTTKKEALNMIQGAPQFHAIPPAPAPVVSYDFGTAEARIAGVPLEPKCTWVERRMLDQLAGLRTMIKANAAATWTTQDGRKIRVQDMSDSHLHFAIAKAYRGEFGTPADRKTGIAALKIEAARRLLSDYADLP